MKKYIPISILMALSFYSYSQLEIGLKLGINTSDYQVGTLIFQDENQLIELNPSKADYGYHFGIYTRLSIASFYLEPAAILNSSRINYNLTEFTEGDVLKSIKTEKFKTLDVPLLIGMKMGIIRFHLGPVAHIVLDSKSELIEIDGYEEKFKNATYGFQLGAGLDLWKLRIDLSYESNFSRFGNHITINGTDLSFNNQLSRVICTLGYKF